MTGVVDFSNPEFWDDGSLVNSWNQAVKEYKHYHSIHARNENVEEVLEKFDDNGDQLQIPDQEDADKSKEGVELPAVLGNEQGERPQIPDNAPSQSSAPSTTQAVPEKGPNVQMPSQLIGQVHDDGLKNLLMSWYYAGYYTGLYEGQQQGKQ